MKHLEQCLEEAQCGIIGGAVERLLIVGLHHLKIPTGELVPEEAIDGHEGIGDTIFLEMVVELHIHSL